MYGFATDESTPTLIYLVDARVRCDGISSSNDYDKAVKKEGNDELAIRQGHGRVQMKPWSPEQIKTEGQNEGTGNRAVRVINWLCVGPCSRMI